MNQALQIPTVSSNETVISEKKQNLLAAANALEITNDEECQRGVDLIAALKGLAKSANDERLKLVKPINDAVKHVNDRFKQYTAPLADAENAVRGKVLAFTQLKEALRREEEEKRRKEEEAERKRIADEEAARLAVAEQNAFAAGADPEAPAPVDRSLPAPDHHVLQPNDLYLTAPKAEPVRVRGDSGALATVKKVWKYRVTDIAELARTNPKAVLPNHEGIMYCINQGIRSMPGLEIYQEDSLQVR